MGQMVVYGIQGVCRIVELADKKVDGRKRSFYVLEPLESADSRYYIPMDNPAAMAKITPILTRQELEKLLADVEGSEKIWIEDENQRKQRYRELISGSDRRSMILMVIALHNHKKQQLTQGRKFHISDENFLRDAEKLLSSEFAVIMDKTPAEVSHYLTQRLEE